MTVDGRGSGSGSGIGEGEGKREGDSLSSFSSRFSGEAMMPFLGADLRGLMIGLCGIRHVDRNSKTGTEKDIKQRIISR